MKDYLNEEVTYIDNATIEETFNIQKNDPDAIKEKILEYFRQLKFFLTMILHFWMYIMSNYLIRMLLY